MANSLARAACLTLAAALLAGPAAAQQPVSARQIADGRPWSMAMAGGPNGALTLNPDGSGQMRAGPMAMNAVWREIPGGLCFKPSLASERCAVLRREGGAIVASQDGREVFRLSR